MIMVERTEIFVIIPVYNCKPYLYKAISSIWNQKRSVTGIMIDRWFSYFV